MVQRRSGRGGLWVTAIAGIVLGALVVVAVLLVINAGGNASGDTNAAGTTATTVATTAPAVTPPPECKQALDAAESGVNQATNPQGVAPYILTLDKLSKQVADPRIAAEIVAVERKLGAFAIAAETTVTDTSAVKAAADALKSEIPNLGAACVSG